MAVRQPAVAGQFYNSDGSKLRTQIKEFLEHVKMPVLKDLKSVKGVVVPHAGHIYSGQTAAYAYSLLPKETKQIAMLGPSHFAYFETALVDKSSAWLTPLGELKVAEDATKVDDNRHIFSDSLPHASEHSLEVQAPFIQVCCPAAKIIPMLVGQVSSRTAAGIAQRIIEALPDSFILVSTDLSHYNRQGLAEKIDKDTLSSIQSLNSGGPIDACGMYPLIVAIEICKIKGWKMELLHYSTSGDTSGDYDSVVGYAALAFGEK